MLRPSFTTLVAAEEELGRLVTPTGRPKAGERYEAFITALGRRLAKGPKLRQEISEDVSGSGSQ
mgnify:CR=1 FL=1